MMKRILAVLLAVVMIMSLAACSSKDTEKEKETEKKQEEVKKQEKTDINIVDNPEPNNTNYTDGDSISPVAGIWSDDNYYRIELGEDYTYHGYYYSPAGSEETLTEEGEYEYDGTYLNFYPYDGSEGHLIPDLTYDPDDHSFTDDYGTEFNFVGELGTVDPVPTEEPVSPETVGYFNYYDITGNTDLSNRVKFKKGGAYVQSDGTGYKKTNITLQTDCLEFSEDDGNGTGHAIYKLSIFFKGDDRPSDFKKFMVSSYYELYDTFTGEVISPDVIINDSPDNYWASEYTSVRPDGNYLVTVVQTENFKHNTDGYLTIFEVTYGVYFTVGYSGVDMIVFPAFDNRNDWDGYHQIGTYDGKILDDPYLKVDGAKIFELF